MSNAIVLTKFEKTALIQTRATEISLVPNASDFDHLNKNDNLKYFKQAADEYKRGKIPYNVHRKSDDGTQTKIFDGPLLQQQTANLFWVKNNPENKIPGVIDLDQLNCSPLSPSQPAA